MKNTALLLGILFLLSACQSKNKLKLATGSTQSIHFAVGSQLRNLIQNQNQEYSLKLLTEGEGSKANLQQLLDNQSDFALVQNDITSSKDLSKVRTVLPLYPQILFITLTLKPNL